MHLFGHHATGYLEMLGLDIEVNGRDFPDGATEHVVALVVLVAVVVFMSYGIFAMIRDFIRWRQRAKN